MPDRSVALLVFGIATIGFTPVLMLIVYLARGRKETAKSRLGADSRSAAGPTDSNLRTVAISLAVVATLAGLAAWWVMGS